MGDRDKKWRKAARLLGFCKQEMGCPEDKTVSQANNWEGGAHKASVGLEGGADEASGPEGRSRHNYAQVLKP